MWGLQRVSACLQGTSGICEVAIETAFQTFGTFTGRMQKMENQPENEMETVILVSRHLSSHTFTGSRLSRRLAERS